MIRLSDAEITQFSQMREQAAAGAIGYWQIYESLANLLQSKYAVPATDSALLWLRGATEANAGRGAMFELIRAYTEAQYQLRYGSSIPAGRMQEASNAVARNLLADLLGDNDQEGSAIRWPKGQVPDITRIAVADASAVGRVLFNRDASDTAAELQQNSAWSVTLLFGLLRSDQSGRLTNSGTLGSIHTLNDWRDVLYAAVSYAQALPAANSVYWSGSAAQMASDAMVLGTTVISYFNSGHTTGDVWNAVTLGVSGGVVGDAFSRIGNAGPNRFLGAHYFDAKNEEDYRCAA